MMLKDRLEIKSKLADQEKPLEYLCATVKFVKIDHSVLNRIARRLREVGRPYSYIQISYTNIQYIKNTIRIQQCTKLPTNRHELNETTLYFLIMIARIVCGRPGVQDGYFLLHTTHESGPAPELIN
jgi:hypothetical protein